MYAPEYGFMGTNGIVGAGILLATGSALSAQLRKTGQVVVAFFGDGAVNSGSFHEGLNFGAVWNLPIVYVCENNLYATEMAFRRATKNTSVQSRAAAYKLPGVEVDGSDVLAIHATAGAAIERARSGGGPTLIEAKTYRFVGHHEGDPGTAYRTREEVEKWKSRCPIRTLREKLLTNEGASLQSVEQIEREVQQWIEAAVQFARESPEPAPSTVHEHVYS